MALVTWDLCSALPGLHVKGLSMFQLLKVPACQPAHSEASCIPATTQTAVHYPPLSSLSSLHLLIKEFLVLERGEKKTNAEVWIKFGERLF